MSRGGSRKTVTSETLVVDGLRVTVNRKRVKNMTLHIKQPAGDIEVSVPLHEPLSSVEHMIRTKRRWIDRHVSTVTNSVAARAAEADAAETEEWKAVVSACVPALIEAWEPIMGVKAGSVVYRNMKSRWGSCQPTTGRICINTRLALYPPECLEYVVVHELCHLIERGHGPRFKAAMDAFMPDWRQRRKKLNSL